MNTELVVISVLCGVVVAGFVWFGWSVAENVLHIIRNRGGNGQAQEDIDEF